jgi:hypothetical protein
MPVRSLLVMSVAASGSVRAGMKEDSKGERVTLKTGSAWLGFVAGLLVVGGVALGLPASVLHAEGEPSPAVSAEAWKKMVDDAGVSAIVTSQVKAIDKSMKSAGTFRRALKKVEITGRILAVAGNVETFRTEGDAGKKGAALREAGLALTKAATDKKFEDAEKALAKVKAFPESIELAADGKPTDWKSLMDMDGLMTGVASADNELKAIVTGKPEEFKKSAKDVASWGMLMAYFGRVTREHEADEDWKKWCDDMSTHSLALAKALTDKDLDAAKASRDELMKSCEACHEAYRVEE